MKFAVHVIGAGLLALFATSAVAQVPTTPTVRGPEDPLRFQRDRNISVRQRGVRDYEPLGMRVGSFRLDSSLLLSAGYVDNVFATDINEQSSGVFHAAPSLNLASTWSRHAFGASLNADFAGYNEFESENYTAWSAGALTRLDFADQLNVGGSASYSEQVEPRTSSSSPGLVAEPVQYSLGQGQATIAKTFNRVRISGAAAFRNFNFEDTPSFLGAQLDQDYRDQLQSTFSARADYALSPDTSLFGQVIRDNRNYDEEPPAVALDRDSHVTAALVGANFEVSALVRGELGVGYQWIEQESDAFQDDGGFNARAELEYFVSPLATITLSASRSFQDAGIPTSSGYISSAINARVDYEARRNIILGARIGYEDNRFLDITRRDKRFSAGAHVNYYLNRRVSLNLTYDHLQQRSKGQFARTPFDVNTFTVGATLRY